MPTCRHCHNQISRFDVDVCPYCGTASPIEEGYKTMDVTKTIGDLKLPKELYKSRSRLSAALLSFFLGPFGFHFFYLRKPIAGILALLATCFGIAGLGTLVYWFAFRSIWAFLIFVIIDYAVYAGFGLFYLTYDSAKDGKGELLR